jgi:serine/threonine protein kinase
MTPCGTYEYAAPEVIQEIEYSKKVDMWALGCALFTLLVAYPPFYDDENGLIGDKIRMGQFEFLSPWWDGISADAKHLISGLLEVDPRARFGTVEVANHAWLSIGKLSPAGQGTAVNHTARGASWASRSATPGVLSPGVCRAFHRADNSWSPIAETLKTPAAQTPYLSDNENLYPSYFQGTEEQLSGDTEPGGECCIAQSGPIELSSPMPWTPFQDSPRSSTHHHQIDQKSWREAVNAPLKHFTETTSLGLDRDLSLLSVVAPGGTTGGAGNHNPFELNLSSSTLHKKRHLK